MRVAHIGPPLAAQGGPAGYLLALFRAYEESHDKRHHLLFPPLAPATVVGSSAPLTAVRGRLGRAKRAILGRPAMYRPPLTELRQPRGRIHEMMSEIDTSIPVDCGASLQHADSADVLFVHEVSVARRLLESRRPNQQIWLFLHSPMPMPLFLVWSWGVPELDWREISAFPDVAKWTEDEIRICEQVDKVVLPCPEAAEGFIAIDPRFTESLSGASYVLTGTPELPDRRPRTSETRAVRWNLPDDQPVLLFLGNEQPYRGLDALIAGATHLDSGIRGVVAVAGPDRERLPRHSRLRALGRVSEVGDLLAAVDGVVNVNRFSLFDLSTIESAAAGKPLVLHAVGGNKAFRRLGAGCLMFDDIAPQTVAAALNCFFSLGEQERTNLGAASRRCWEEHLSPRRFIANHFALYDVAAVGADGGVPA
jgi:glycosyltransferase involved in cell wall biosynthesis